MRHAWEQGENMWNRHIVRDLKPQCSSNTSDSAGGEGRRRFMKMKRAGCDEVLIHYIGATPCGISLSLFFFVSNSKCFSSFKKTGLYLSVHAPAHTHRHTYWLCPPLSAVFSHFKSHPSSLLQRENCPFFQVSFSSVASSPNLFLSSFFPRWFKQRNREE